MTTADLDNLLSVPEMARRYANVFPSEQSLRWLLRYRRTNGLLDCGAVVELRAAPGQRPRLLVNPARLVPWVMRQSSRAAALAG